MLLDAQTFHYLRISQSRIDLLVLPLHVLLEDEKAFPIVDPTLQPVLTLLCDHVLDFGLLEDVSLRDFTLNRFHHGLDVVNTFYTRDYTCNLVHLDFIFQLFDVVASCFVVHISLCSLITVLGAHCRLCHAAH